MRGGLPVGAVVDIVAGALLAGAAHPGRVPAPGQAQHQVGELAVGEEQSQAVPGKVVAGKLTNIPINN